VQFLAPLVGILCDVRTIWAAQPTIVRMSYASRSNSNIPLQIALTRGFFTEAGMDVELIQVNPRLAGTALLGGDLDFSTFG